MIEIRVVGARCDDQGVVGDRAAVGDEDLATLRVEPDGLTQDHGRVALLSKHRAQRLGDVAWRQRAGRDLVEQRLEQVEVAPIDQGQADLGIDPEVARRVEPAEPATDDGHPMRLGRPVDVDWSRP